MRTDNYTLTVNSLNLSDCIKSEDNITGYEQYQTSGFNGEIYTVFTSTLSVIIQIASYILQWHNQKSVDQDRDKLDKDKTMITIVGPNGFEYRNVPLSRISELLHIINDQE
jgi:hypothetical protein